jgi:hypothetical protein
MLSLCTQDIRRTGGRGCDLPSEAVLREYLQFPYEYFILVLPFGVYCCKLFPSDNPRRKLTKLRSDERAGQIPLLIIVPEDIGQSLHTRRYTCSVGSS